MWKLLWPGWKYDEHMPKNVTWSYHIRSLNILVEDLHHVMPSFTTYRQLFDHDIQTDPPQYLRAHHLYRMQVNCLRCRHQLQSMLYWIRSVNELRWTPLHISMKTLSVEDQQCFYCCGEEMPGKTSKPLLETGMPFLVLAASENTVEINAKRLLDNLI